MSSYMDKATRSLALHSCLWIDIFSFTEPKSSADPFNIPISNQLHMENCVFPVSALQKILLSLVATFHWQVLMKNAQTVSCVWPSPLNNIWYKSGSHGLVSKPQWDWVQDSHSWLVWEWLQKVCPKKGWNLWSHAVLQQASPAVNTLFVLTLCCAAANTSWNYKPQSPTCRPLLQVCSPLLAGQAKSWDWKSRRNHLHHLVSVWWGIGNHSSTVCTNKSSGATSFLAQLKHIFGTQTTAWKTGGVLPPLYKKCFSPRRTKCKEVCVLCLN